MKTLFLLLLLFSSPGFAQEYRAPDPKALAYTSAEALADSPQARVPLNTLHIEKDGLKFNVKANEIVQDSDMGDILEYNIYSGEWEPSLSNERRAVYNAIWQGDPGHIYQFHPFAYASSRDSISHEEANCVKIQLEALKSSLGQSDIREFFQKMTVTDVDVSISDNSNGFNEDKELNYGLQITDFPKLKVDVVLSSKKECHSVGDKQIVEEIRKWAKNFAAKNKIIANKQESFNSDEQGLMDLGNDVTNLMDKKAAPVQ
jgi:hypothetical protein